MPPTSLLHVDDLRKSYGAHEVLKGVSFALSKGEKLAIIGPSGSGKSTCLRCVNYLEVPTGGSIRLDGVRIGEVARGNGGSRRMSDRELAPQRSQMGMVFQSFNLWPHLTVKENVALGPQKVAGLSRQDAFLLAEEMLAKVHMTHKTDAYPDNLSGGQQQRVAIARALAQKPKLLLFDEPTSALDPELVGEVLNVIHELADEGRSMILVTHEISFARDVADQILFMDGGFVVEHGTPSQVLKAPQMERTRSFLRQIQH